jgi:hypothetical protein
MTWGADQHQEYIPLMSGCVVIVHAQHNRPYQTCQTMPCHTRHPIPHLQTTALNKHSTACKRITEHAEMRQEGRPWHGMRRNGIAWHGMTRTIEPAIAADAETATARCSQLLLE